jgi:pimeloyl-ACP methyl ester carboxylesterase
VRGSEAQALGTAGADLVADVTGWVEGVHRAVAARVFRSIGPIAAPVQVVHDAIAGAVYTTVRTLVAGGARVAGTVGALALDEGRPGLDATPAGAAVKSAVNGVLGDRLERDAPALAVAASWRHDGQDVTADELARRTDAPSSHVAVFVHGLCESEAAWGWRTARHGTAGGHPARVAADLGATPALVRLNTGRGVADNGADLSRLLDALVAAWPVEVERVALVGHSMGGLIARSAVLDGARRSAGWVPLVTDLVCLGTPLLGAPLERAATAGAALLALVPETAPFGSILEARSVGITDLRVGDLVEDEWRVQGSEVAARLAGVRTHVVAATVGGSDRGVLASTVGDWLVPASSAAGAGRRRRLHADSTLHVARADHFDLLADRRVGDHLVELLRRR